MARPDLLGGDTRDSLLEDTGAAALTEYSGAAAPSIPFSLRIFQAIQRAAVR